jgi:hypothetical protein
MVAKVNSGKNIRGVLNYNEKKVKEGVARCIHENLFGRDVAMLTFNAKLKGFENYISQNRRATTNAVHISLNFHASENLNQDRLTEIATTYMDKIGFGNQPYLVYEHLDAAHPHIHIVTTNIDKEGKRILLYNIGKNQSEKARKEIETDFKLVKASGRSHHPEEIRAVDIQKVSYGKSETKRSIANVVRSVVRSYKYTSLPELNAVLRQYNVMADRGSERSGMNANKGLVYRVIDDTGKKVGVPIKASAIYGKPTLPYLERQFKLNEALRIPHKERLKKCLDDAIKGMPSFNEATFLDALSKEGITALFRKNEAGRIYGITFVDNNTKAVFNGSDLGKAYSANAITEKLVVPAPAQAGRAAETPKTPPQPSGSFEAIARHVEPDSDFFAVVRTSAEQLIIDLTEGEAFDHSSPDAAMKRRRKKPRRKRKSL